MYNQSKAISVSDFGNPTGLWKDRRVILQGFKHLFHGSVFLFRVFKHPYRETNFMYLNDWGDYTNYWVPPDRKSKVHAEVISSKRLSQKLARESKQKRLSLAFTYLLYTITKSIQWLDNKRSLFSVHFLQQIFSKMKHFVYSMHKDNTWGTGFFSEYRLIQNESYTSIWNMI